MSYQEFLIRIFLCFIISFCIGLERQWRRRAIGLRTNVLVCIGSFLFVTFSIQTNAKDISRIAAQVVSGIGFLGAGVILKAGANVNGLNTAATLWCNAAIGTLCAAGLLIEALIGGLLILFSNIILRFVAQKMNVKANNMKFSDYKLKVICDEDKEFVIRTLISQSVNDEYMLLTNMENNDLDEGKVKISATFQIATDKKNQMEELINRIVLEPGVTSSGWKKLEVVKNSDEDDDEI